MSTEQDREALIADARSRAESLRRTFPNDGEIWDDARLIERLADAIDALVKERDELAAVIEKAQQAGEVTGYSHHKEPVMEALSTAPADALREVKAQAWREGWDASERFGYLDGALETSLNPYLEADDDF